MPTAAKAKQLPGQVGRRQLGHVEQRTWTVIQHEIDGVGQPLGERYQERSIYLAWLDECRDTAAAWRADGFVVDSPVATATDYFGPTDSPSNCWYLQGRRELSRAAFRAHDHR